MSLRGEGSRQPRETHEKKSASTFARLPSFRIQQEVTEETEDRVRPPSVPSVSSCSKVPAPLAAERKGQRPEPAAAARFVSERIGWLPFAAPSCPSSPVARDSPEPQFGVGNNPIPPSKRKWSGVMFSRYSAPGLASDRDFHFASELLAYPPTLSVRCAAIVSAGMIVSE